MYKLTDDLNRVQRISDGAFIPIGTNGDWQLYQEWLDLGNTPELANPLVRTIDKRRLRVALSRLGLLDDLAAAVAGAEAMLQWEDVTVLSEADPLVRSLIQGLNWDAATVDSIFNLAFTL